MRYSTMRDGPGSFRPLWQDIQFARNVWVFPGSTRFLWMNVSTDGVYEVAIGDRHWSVPVVEGTRQSLAVDGLAAGEQAISITLRRNDGQLATVRESFRVLDDVTAVCVRQRMAAIEQASGGDQLLVAAYLEEEGLWFEAVDRLERSDARLHREYVGLLYAVYRNSRIFREWWTVWQCVSPEFGACPLPPDGTVRDMKTRASRDR